MREWEARITFPRVGVKSYFLTQSPELFLIGLPMGLVGVPSIPASGISHLTEEAGKPTSGQLQSQQGLGARMQAGDCAVGYQADQCLGPPVPWSVQAGLPRLLNSTPSALSDPLFKFSACLALHKIISIHLFLVLALRHYSLQDLSAQLTDAPISTRS